MRGVADKQNVLKAVLPMRSDIDSGGCAEEARRWTPSAASAKTAVFHAGCRMPRTHGASWLLPFGIVPCGWLALVCWSLASQSVSSFAATCFCLCLLPGMPARFRIPAAFVFPVCPLASVSAKKLSAKCRVRLHLRPAHGFALPASRPSVPCRTHIIRHAFRNATKTLSAIFDLPCHGFTPDTLAWWKTPTLTDPHALAGRRPPMDFALFVRSWLRWQLRDSGCRSPWLAGNPPLTFAWHCLLPPRHLGVNRLAFAYGAPSSASLRSPSVSPRPSLSPNHVQPLRTAIIARLSLDTSELRIEKRERKVEMTGKEYGRRKGKEKGVLWRRHAGNCG